EPVAPDLGPDALDGRAPPQPATPATAGLPEPADQHRRQQQDGDDNHPVGAPPLSFVSSAKSWASPGKCTPHSRHWAAVAIIHLLHQAHRTVLASSPRRRRRSSKFGGSSDIWHLRQTPSTKRAGRCVDTARPLPFPG